MSADSLPTLWDPQKLFFHLLLYAGMPAAVVAVMTALLASYKAVMGWIGFGKTTVRMGIVAGDKVKEWTSEQLRALVALGFFSVITVCSSYMLAVIGYAATLMIEADPQHVFTPGELANHVSVALWPPVAVWIVVGEIACVVILGIAGMGRPAACGSWRSSLAASSGLLPGSSPSGLASPRSACAWGYC